jgi:CDP-diacylglycerol--serine O-phosphatidyltransferase
MKVVSRPKSRRRWKWHRAAKKRRSAKHVKLATALRSLPTLLTLSNACCGLGGIVVATGAMRDLPWVEAMFFAGLLIFLGMFFDMLDGQAARWLKQTSPFGAQLDSLCDVITFGAAPAFIMTTFSESFSPWLLLGIGAVYFVCAVLRLARFNLETKESDPHEMFSGLPAPAAAGTIASFAVVVPGLCRLRDHSPSAALQQLGATLIASMVFVLPLLAILLAWLMVSRVPYPHVVNQWVRRRFRRRDVARAALIVLAMIIVHELALPLIFCHFVLEPGVRTAWHRLHPRPRCRQVKHGNENSSPEMS